MPADCKNINPLLRSGTSQHKRVLEALLPANAKVDDRSYADLILFAKKYAAHLAYYDSSNRIDGNWTTLMKMDVSVTLASIAKQDANVYLKYISSLYNTINQLYEEQNAGYEAEMQAQYKYIYDFITTLIYQLDEHLDALPQETGFKESLALTIQSRLADLNLKLKLYYDKSAQNPDAMLDNTSTVLPTDSPIALQPTQELRKFGLSFYWASSLVFTPPIYPNTAANKIRYTVNHSVFKGIIEGFLKVYSTIIKTAKKYLEETLEHFPTHTPHYALYLTFIKLFKFAQNDLNKFTDRHLRLYYEEILRLKPAEPVADNAYLLFELQKNVESHLLPENTIFKAGKDASGKDLLYALTEDIVINKGAVKSIKSIFNQKKTFVGKPSTTVYYAPISKSGDGKGGKFTSADNSWEPFGDPSINEPAKVGFAVAHPILFLKEGTRKIILWIYSADYSKLTGISNKYFTAELTGEKGWQTATVTEAKIESGFFKIALELPTDAQAIVPYSEAIHLTGFDKALPVLKIYATNTSDQYNYLDVLAELNIISVTINVDVQGLKDLSIQNELSTLDPAKPFPIFGPQPHMGSTFTIGSNEVFLKNINSAVSAHLNLEWDNIGKLDIGTNDVTYNFNKTVGIKYLHNGTWVDTYSQHTLFYHEYPTTHKTVNGIEIHVDNLESVPLLLPQLEGNFDFASHTPYNIHSKNGFMQLEFRGPTDFGHSDFVKRFTEASLDDPPGTLPSEPYTPTVKSISLDYTASATIALTSTDSTNFTDKKGYFFHVTPFGSSYQHKFILGSAASIKLLPALINEGEIFIGIENFKANQSLNLLFKVSEGSADPTKERQTLEWTYLSLNNIWKAFAKGSVIDETNDLTKTGIIHFGFPEDATDINILMGETLFWIRGAVKQDSSAVCNIIDVHAQAATARLTDYYNTGVVFSAILPANTISKLLISDASIKKITQPYASFGGKTREVDSSFYTRVSERLRHKQRGITMWDYERLVLQQFPEIYKVKCINHAKLNPSNTMNELAPGHVMIIPIPDLRGLNAVDPLRPQTSLGTLTDIKLYLHRHISPFVKLDVKNALFEEIQLDFKVQFNTDEGAYYHNYLMDQIEQYLSPWAFDATSDIEFGGKISKSRLLNFIEEQSYVDYITCFKMYHIVNGVKSADVEEAVATSSRSIFVSYGGDNGDKSTRHLINYTNPDCNC